MSFQGRVAFITGAAGGIGLQIARDMAREGARVALSDLPGAGLEAAVESLRKEGRETLAAPCDVTREEQLSGAIDSAVARWGRLDILVNNAGLQHVSPIESFPTERYRFLLEQGQKGLRFFSGPPGLPLYSLVAVPVHGRLNESCEGQALWICVNFHKTVRVRWQQVRARADAVIDSAITI